MTNKIFCLLILILLFCLVNFAQVNDINKINFKKVKYPVGKELSQKDLKVDNVAYGDLDGDSKDEAAVKISWSFANYGGNGYGYFLFVYKLKNKSLSLISKIDGGAKSDFFLLKSIEINNLELETTQCETDKNYSKFYLATIHYKLKNNKLIQLRKFRNQIEDQCFLD